MAYGYGNIARTTPRPQGGGGGGVAMAAAAVINGTVEQLFKNKT